MGRMFVLALVLVGCTSSDSVLCDDGRTCPENTVCAAVSNPDELLCVAPEQIAVCVGATEGAECTTETVTTGRCYTGVCLDAFCGNARVDPGEVCDDGNAVAGDGCAFSCASNETCGNTYLDPVLLDEMGAPQPNENCDDGNVYGNDGCTAVCDPEEPAWRFADSGSPLRRADTAMVWDPVRRRGILFGGAMFDANSTVFTDTWEYDGKGWLQVPVLSEPSKRYGHAMAFDTHRRRALLFGGALNVAYDEFYEYDGTTWRELLPLGARPPARHSAGLVYDAKRKRTVLFGGAAGNFSAQTDVLADTWEWDGTVWSQYTGSGPPKRYGHVMVYDPVRGVTVVAGGRATKNGAALTDTWEFDGTWRMASNNTPLELFEAGAAFDHSGRLVVAYGGLSGTTVSTKAFAWNGTTWTELGTAPPARRSLAMTSDPVRGRLVIFGGFLADNTTTTAETFERDPGGTWTPVVSLRPGLRTHFRTVYDARRGRAVMVGGSSDLFVNWLDDTWEFDGTHWERFPASIAGRYLPGLAYDSKRGETVMFGGFLSNATYSQQTYVWNGTSWTLRTPATSPPARAFTSMAYDIKRDRIVLFGGTSGGSNGSKADTWEWDGTTWVDRTPPFGSPAAREDHIMVYDPVRERTIMAFGHDQDRGVFEWDGTTWTQVGDGPAPRSVAGAAWNPARRAITVYGGRQAFEVGETYEMRDRVWTRTADGPERMYHGVFQTRDGGGLLSYGGYTLRPSIVEHEDLHRMRYEAPTTYESCAADVDDDGDSLAGCADPDCWASCAPLCMPGVACDPSGPRCGDGTCSPVENCRLCADDCSCPPVCGDSFCEGSETASNCPGDC